MHYSPDGRASQCWAGQRILSVSQSAGSSQRGMWEAPPVHGTILLMTDSSPNKSKRWRGIAQIVISVTILIWLFNSFGFQSIIEQLTALNGWYYALAGVVFLLSILARAWRWYVLLTPLGVQVPIRDLFLLYLIGFFWNSFLPSGFGGDVVKAIELRRRSQQGAAAVTSVLAERILGLLATSLIGVIIILLQPGFFPPIAIAIVVGMAIAIIGGIWFLRLNLLSWFGQHLPFTHPLVTHRRAIAFHESIRVYDLRALLMGLLASVPFTLTSILDNYLVGLALNVPLGFRYYALYTPIISIVGLLPLSFNGVGVREYTYKLLFGLVDIPPEQAIAMALAFNLLRFGAGLIGGVVSLAGGLQRITDAETQENEDQHDSD